MKEKIAAHYHWIIAGMVLLEMTVFGGLFNNITGLYLLPVTEEFGISRGTFSLVMCIRNVTAMVSTMLSGILLLRFGYRKMITVSMLIAAAGCVILTAAPSLPWFGVGIAVAGLCEGICNTAGVSKIIGDWFHRSRGTVMGVVTAFTGIGGSIFCTFYSWILQSRGYRAAYAVTAIIFVVTTAALALVIRNRPDDLGLRPYGEGQLPTKKRHGAQNKDKIWAGFDLRALTRMPAFYLLLAATFLSSINMYGMFHCLVPHARDLGFSAAQAAVLQSTMLLMLAAGKFVSGILCDKIGARWTTVLCILISGIGIWLSADADTMPVAIAATVLYSLGLPLTTLVVPLLVSALFGYRAHDTAVGIILSMITIGNLLGNALINLLYDWLGSYSPVLRLGLIFSIGVIVIYEILFRQAGRNRKKWLESHPKQVEAERIG